MILNPPYNNGRDPVIIETNLERPLSPEEWQLAMPQPKPKPSAMPAELRPTKFTRAQANAVRAHEVNA